MNKSMVITGVFLLSISCSALAGKVDADLDGDGKSEPVTWESKVDELNGIAMITIKAGEENWTFKGEGFEVNVSKINPWGTEGRDILTVSLPLESDFRTIILVGKSDKDAKLGELDRISAFGDVRFPGNGSCVTNNWEGFWSRVDKHVLSSKGKLSLVSQPYYHVGIAAKSTGSFPIHKERGKDSPLATIGAGSEITLVLCAVVPDKDEDVDPMLNDYYLVRSVSGFLGWVRFGDVRDKLELPWAG